MSKSVSVVCVALSLAVSGCAAKEAACAVVKTAADVCTVIEYVGEDGKTYRVKVTKEQLDGLVREQAKKDGLPAPKVD